MQKNKFILLFAALLGFSVLFTGCKYEEGPAVSLIPKKERVANTWKFESVVEADGDNISGTYDDHIATLTSEGTFTWTGTILGIGFTNSGTWVFTADKENIKFNFDKTTAFPFTTTDEFQILKLKSDDFWFVDLDGERAEFHLTSNE